MRKSTSLISVPYRQARALYRSTRSGLFSVAEAYEKHRLKGRLGISSGGANEIIVVMMVRNEALRLEYFFKYYKDLGVSRFFVLDHESTDRTAELIENEYAAVRIPVAGNFIFKRTWLEAVLETVAVGKWCLVLDADEFLVWPQMQHISLMELITYMDAEDFEVFTGVLLDMYPQGAVGGVRYRAGENPLDYAPFFDKSGMTRARSFGVSPVLKKAPLLRFRPGMRIAAGQHHVGGAKYGDISGALLHFKFLQDFASKIRTNQLFRIFDRAYSRELAAYQSKLRKDQALDLYSEESVRYTGPEQLVELGFMEENTKLREFAESKTARAYRSPA